MQEEEPDMFGINLKKSFIILTDFENDYPISLNKSSIVAFHRSKLKEGMTVVYTSIYGRVFEVKESVEDIKKVL